MLGNFQSKVRGGQSKNRVTNNKSGIINPNCTGTTRVGIIYISWGEKSLEVQRLGT